MAQVCPNIAYSQRTCLRLALVSAAIPPPTFWTYVAIWWSLTILVFCKFTYLSVRECLRELGKRVLQVSIMQQYYKGGLDCYLRLNDPFIPIVHVKGDFTIKLYVALY